MLEDSAVGMGETVLSSTHASMLENDRRHLENILDRIGHRRHVLALRLVDERGAVRYSNDSLEVGRRMDLTHPVCRGCHEEGTPIPPMDLRDGLRVYRTEGGGSALGLGVPILNTPECSNAACHAHSADIRVLGMLDIELSTESLDAAMRRSRSQMAMLGVGVIVVLVGIVGGVTTRVVNRPFRSVLAGIRAAGSGELSRRVEGTSPAELGELASAFNSMLDQLERAQEELATWNRKLQAGIVEKTRELEETRDQMVFSEKMASLGKLAAIVAHEINNPLAGVMMQAKLAHRRLPRLLEEGRREELEATLTTIETETARCGDIVRDLLLFARQGSGTYAPEDINARLDRVVRLVQHKADLSEVRVHVERDPAAPDIYCNGSEIEQAVLAVVINGLEAMSDGGDLSLATHYDAGRSELEITVADTGCGIPDEVKPRIFEPFFSTKTEGHGTGLGLAVLYGIVKRHGGRVTFDSHPDRGTVFRIVLPAGKTTSGAPSREATEVKT
jgi:two-component system NtrC family sensor kinase